MARFLSDDIPYAGDNEVIAEYLERWTHSPYWDSNVVKTDDGREALRLLRVASKALFTRGQLRVFVEALITSGLDPL